MRFFIAIEISEESRNQIQEVQIKLKQLVPQARLTKPEQLHLTLAFIGEQPDNLKDTLIEIIKKVVLGIPPFEITPGFIDGFPHLHSAHTLWIGVKGDIDKLYKLKHRIKDGLKGLNLMVDERRFVPHIALAKLTSFKLDKETEKEFENMMATEFFPIKVTSVKLFESIPEHGFHRHNTLAEVDLSP